MQIVPLAPADAERFLAIRADALAQNPESFRYGPGDDAALGLAAWRERLARDHVVAAVADDGSWLGVGGFTRLPGVKLQHKGLIWGMYVTPAARGTGAADAILAALVDHARGRVRQLQLTVMADNSRARAFYERYGFTLYAVEPASVRRGDSYDDEALMWRPL